MRRGSVASSGASVARAADPGAAGGGRSGSACRRPLAGLAGRRLTPARRSWAFNPFRDVMVTNRVVTGFPGRQKDLAASRGVGRVPGGPRVDELDDRALVDAGNETTRSRIAEYIPHRQPRWQDVADLVGRDGVHAPVGVDGAGELDGELLEVRVVGDVDVGELLSCPRWASRMRTTEWWRSMTVPSLASVIVVAQQVHHRVGLRELLQTGRSGPARPAARRDSSVRAPRRALSRA